MLRPQLKFALSLIVKSPVPYGFWNGNSYETFKDSSETFGRGHSISQKGTHQLLIGDVVK